MIEIEFRDGKRLVPDHLADMLADLPTHTLTYEQATEKANWKLASDHLNRVQEQAVQSHVLGLRGRR
jgi:hypothetical protein